MSITRLQQARQMYAMGQRVGRIAFGGGGSQDHLGGGYQGGATNQGGAGNPSGNNGNKSNDKPETTRHNPHTDSGTSKTSTVTGKEMESAARDFVQTLNTNNAIRANQTGTKFEAFDNFVPNFAPKQKKGFGLLDIGLMLATGGLFGAKAKTAAQLFGTTKRANNLVNTLSNTFGFENPIANMFSKNNKSTSKSKSTKKNNTTIKDSSSDREGIATLDNQAGNYDEYILLLQKLQSGTISDSERNRYNVLKNMLGI